MSIIARISAHAGGREHAAARAAEVAHTAQDHGYTDAHAHHDPRTDTYVVTTAQPVHDQRRVCR